jgi:hypothetical protein
MSLMRCVGGSMHGKHVNDMPVFRCVVPKDEHIQKHWQSTSDISDYVNYETYHRFELENGMWAVLNTMRSWEAAKLMEAEGWLK